MPSRVAFTASVGPTRPLAAAPVRRLKSGDTDPSSETWFESKSTSL